MRGGRHGSEWRADGDGRHGGHVRDVMVTFGGGMRKRWAGVREADRRIRAHHCTLIGEGGARAQLLSLIHI
eukprot:3663631-Prymnesium_polylepis.1